MATDKRFNKWEAALAASASGQPFTGFAKESPECGFYRCRANAKAPWRPVGIFPDLNEDAPELDGIVYEVDGKDAPRNLVVQLWSSCAQNPISYAVYCGVTYDGAPWPDVPDAVAAHVASNEPGEGDNSRNAVEEVVDPVKAVEKQIEAAKTDIDKYKVITSDEQNASALSLENRLTELAGIAERTRKREKQPHWDKGLEVDAKWKPLITDATDAATTVNRARIAWGRIKRQRQLAEEAKVKAAEDARVAAEQQQARDEAEAAAAEAAKLAPALDEAFGPAVIEPEPEPVRAFSSVLNETFGDAPAPTPVKPPISAPVKPGYGRASSFVTVWKLTEVTDYDALYAHLKNLPQVQQVLRDRAAILVRQGTHVIPGCKIEEDVAAT
jgi:hypothetical protein